MLRRAARAVWAFFKDPFRFERDWSDFESMTDAELREEWFSLLEQHKSSLTEPERFRRLCQFLSVRWVCSEQELFRP